MNHVVSECKEANCQECLDWAIAQEKVDNADSR